MAQENDLYIIHEAVEAAADAKEAPQNLQDNPDLAGQYAYDPYVKEDKACATYEKVAGTKITLNLTELSIEKTHTETLTATVSPTSTETVNWSSSDTSVATVEDGVVTAVKAGEATITASINGKTATCAVAVGEATTG